MKSFMPPDIKNKFLCLLVLKCFPFWEIEKCIHIYIGGQVYTEAHILKNNIGFLIKTLLVSLGFYKKLKLSYKEISNT